MQSKSLSISGFRGFKDPQTLALSDLITILEGPNQSGKTSIGEAVGMAAVR
jgi:recombinational DNA repair ATPase RecF